MWSIVDSAYTVTTQHECLFCLTGAKHFAAKWINIKYWIKTDTETKFQV